MTHQTRVLIDANILLADFFWRCPEYARTHGLPEEQAQAADRQRELVHQALQALADAEGVLAATTLPILLRFNSILCDLRLPPQVVSDELTYWLENLVVIDLDQNDARQALAQMHYGPAEEGKTYDTEAWLLLHACRKAQLNYVFTASQRSHTHIEEIRLLSPQNILDWAASAQPSQ